MRIKKVEKLVANLLDKTEYVIHIRNLKQALNHRLVWKKNHEVIRFNQNASLKPYIDMNTDLRKKAKSDFEKDIFKLMNNAIFEKTMKTCRNRKKKKIFGIRTKLSYYKAFYRKCIGNRNEKTEILINKLVCTCLYYSILLYGYR